MVLYPAPLLGPPNNNNNTTTTTTTTTAAAAAAAAAAPFKLRENQETAQRDFFQFFGVWLVCPIR